MADRSRHECRRPDRTPAPRQRGQRCGSPAASPARARPRSHPSPARVLPARPAATLRPMPPVRVLFVCMGNICRSPTAEGVMRALVADAGLSDAIEIDSAGTGGWHAGAPPDSRAVAAARLRGIELTGAARQVRRRDFEDFDLLVALDADNARDLRRLAPDADAAAKVRRLREFDPLAGRRPRRRRPLLRRRGRLRAGARPRRRRLPRPARRAARACPRCVTRSPRRSASRSPRCAGSPAATSTTPTPPSWTSGGVRSSSRPPTTPRPAPSRARPRACAGSPSPTRCRSRECSPSPTTRAARASSRSSGSSAARAAPTPTSSSAAASPPCTPPARRPSAASTTACSAR